MADETNVTRIKAKDTSKKAEKTPAKKTKEVVKATKPAKSTESSKNVLFRIGGYFRGAWIELRQVRWPTRRATWGLTLAVILFSAFFVVLILLLDLLFKYIFEIILT